MFKKANRYQIIPSALVFLWIFAINILSPAFLPGVPTWPMYFVTIFFFSMDADCKKIPSIFGGAIMGLLFAWALGNLMVIMTPSIGQLPALGILLFVILGLMIVGGNYCPVLLNNIAFAYLTIATIVFDPVLINNSLLTWILMLVIGGGVILGGSLLILAAIKRHFEKAAAAQ